MLIQFIFSFELFDILFIILHGFVQPQITEAKYKMTMAYDLSLTETNSSF